MKSFLSWLLAIFLVVCLQSSLTYFISFNSIKPDFALIFVAFAGMVSGREQGMIVGFFTGLLYDLLNTGLFGFYSVTFAVIGLYTGTIQKKVYEDSFFLPLVLVFAFSAFSEVLWNACLLLGGYLNADIQSILAIAFVRIFYNTLITIPLLFVFKHVKKFASD